MAMTPGTLANAISINHHAALLWAPHVANALYLCGCETREQVAMWIAQVGHESGGLVRLVESLNYNPQGLMATWPSRYDQTLAQQHGRVGSRPADQRAIAIHVYGDRMGNRPGTEDGWTFRGRGPIQVTGRANYEECGKSIGRDLLTDPSVLEMRGDGAASTAWYWRKHKLAALGDDVTTVTRKINGGLKGLDDRQRRYRHAFAVLKGM